VVVVDSRGEDEVVAAVATEAERVGDKFTKYIKFSVNNHSLDGIDVVVGDGTS
jgi:hypothetical protein